MPVKCRKCSGDHFTSNCGKEKVSKISKENNDNNDNKSNYNKSNDNKSNYNKSSHNKSNYNKSNDNKSNYHKSNDNKSNYHKSNDNKSNYNKSNHNKSNHNKSNNNRRPQFRKYIDSSYSEKTFKVKINNLPHDLTLQNLNKMMIDWGRIGDIKLRQNRSSSYALIDFFDRVARDYFIEALDGTPMGFMILNVTR